MNLMFAEPQYFIQNTTIDEHQLSYEKGLQFYPNMRFSEKIIGYRIDTVCGELKKARVLSALSFIQDNTPVSFREGSDIEVSCQETKQQSEGKYFIAGEGGPTSIINTSLFFVIQQGKALLFYDENNRVCDVNSYNVELHELLHVFGFDHSSNKNSIMYNISDCRQVVTRDIINELDRLYAIPSYGDLAFESASAVKQGRYLNFSIEVRNIGLKDISSSSVEFYQDNTKFYSYDLGAIKFGEAKLVWGLTKMPSDTTNLKYVVSDGSEINYNNNLVSFYLP